MKITNLLSLLTILVGATSCQIGPFYYTLDKESGVCEEFYVPCGVCEEFYVPCDVDNVRSECTESGVAYRAAVNACLMVKCQEDCTDDEWVEEYQDIPGQGYYDGQWSADHADELACVNVSSTGDTYTVDESGSVRY